MSRISAPQRRALGRAVTSARIDAGYVTLQALADEVDVSAKTLGKLEAGSSVGDVTIHRVLKHLHMPDLGRLLEGPEAGAEEPDPRREIRGLSDREYQVLEATLRALREGSASGSGPGRQVG